MERALGLGHKNFVQASALPFTCVITGSHLSISETYLFIFFCEMGEIVLTLRFEDLMK